ncbi:MAG TPA: patatin-like phospholipase family protein, partial [Chitinophagales bacterium]|nr:patatin-like phospholipase family protein [Chitinophagales bacterium]
MRIKLSFVILISVVLLIKEAQADEIVEARPKIGLTLSGGGAKGLIYIPLLKVIDSLGIKIDYLTGTSMGGVIGGLYAIGYTGVELDSIAREIDWVHIIRDKLYMSKVNMEEKEEYGRYLVEVKGNTWKPTLPKGVIEGHNILTFLNQLTSDYLYIDDFSDFKIPFKCFTADLVSGVPLPMSSGNLALALRTTMSIPTVFSPIDTNDMILVDGGLLKNFPVEDVKEMGADFIIGANCSGSEMLKEEMNTLFKIFERMMNVNATENYPKQKELCDILIDFSEALKYLNIGASDFGRVEEILDLGETIVANFIPILAQVAEQQRVFMPQLPDSYVNWRANHAVKLDDIKTSVHDNEFRAIIKNKIEFEDPDHATNYEINRAVDRIYGTRFFDKVYYYYDYSEDSIPKLVYKTEGANKFSYKLGLHYDPELSAGISLNFTYRRLGKMTSRALLSVDVSDNPKVRSGYQVYFGNSSWWLNTEHFFSSIKQTSYAKDGVLGTYKNIYASANLSVNWTIGQNNLVSIGSQIEYLNRKSFLKA